MSLTSYKTVGVALVAAFVSLSCAWAQEATDAAASSDEKPAEEKSAEAQPAAENANAAKFRFAPLMMCAAVEKGTAEIRLPEAESWAAVTVGHYYPFGAEVRFAGADAEKSCARFALGPEAEVAIVGSGSFATAPVAIGAAERCVRPLAGTVTLKLPRTLKSGLMSVAAADFACENLAGDSQFVTVANGESRSVTVRVVTGSLALKGRHYSFPRMGAADQVCVTTSPDALLTTLRGESGDAKVVLDSGVRSILDPETGDRKNVAQSIEYALSPKCAVKIWRRASDKAAGGSGRLAVAVQTFDAQGQDKNFRVFFEDRAEINSGELVPPPVVKKDDGKDKKAKAEGEENSEDGAAEENKEESSDEEKKDDSSDEKKDTPADAAA